jgi:DNA-binding FrmR family transcriptional regulator
MLDSETKPKLQARLKRVAGQISGIQRMVDEDRYCIDVLLQISAARAALAKVSQILLESHIHSCVSDAFESDDPSHREEKVEELIRVFEKNCNC